MDFLAIKTITIVVIILAIIFALFYHAFSVGKEEETT
jgi:hypothetical protein